ncbi:hypothetical protein SLE2022_228990 [Rubroshorea leprosula]
MEIKGMRKLGTGQVLCSLVYQAQLKKFSGEEQLPTPSLKLVLQWEVVILQRKTSQKAEYIKEAGILDESHTHGPPDLKPSSVCHRQSQVLQYNTVAPLYRR